MMIFKQTRFFRSISLGVFFMLSLMLHGFENGVAFPKQAFPSLQDGEPISISDYRGEKVVLHVFASW
jgi:hypothetical protein